MIEYPTFDVDVERRVDVALLGWPERGEADTDSGLGCNRVYIDLRGLTWTEAKRVYHVEEEFIARIEAADDPDEEYEVIEEELYEDAEGIYGLDIGVASTVVALSAARCVPFTSCNAGALGGGTHHEWHPLVAFYAPAAVAKLLLRCAEESAVGLTNHEGGQLLVYARDIRHMRDFARRLIEHRSEINATRQRRMKMEPPKPEQFTLFDDI